MTTQSPLAGLYLLQAKCFHCWLLILCTYLQTHLADGYKDLADPKYYNYVNDYKHDNSAKAF